MGAAHPTVGFAVINPGIYVLEDPRIDPIPRNEYYDDDYSNQVSESQAAGLIVLGAAGALLVAYAMAKFYDGLATEPPELPGL